MDFMQIVYFILFHGCMFMLCILSEAADKTERDIRRKINIYGTIGIFGEIISHIELAVALFVFAIVKSLRRTEAAPK